MASPKITVWFSKYYRPELYAQEPWFDRAHNIVLDWLVNAACPTSIVSLMFVALIFYGSIFGKQSDAGGDDGALYSTFGLFPAKSFVFDNIATYLSFFAISYIYNIAVSKIPWLSRRAGFADTAINGFDMTYAPLAGVSWFLPFILFMRPIGNLMPRILLFKCHQDPYDSRDRRRFCGVSAGAALTRLAIRNSRAVGEIRRDCGYNRRRAGPEKMEVFKFALQETDKSVQENPLDSRPLLSFGSARPRQSFRPSFRGFESL